MYGHAIYQEPFFEHYSNGIKLERKLSTSFLKTLPSISEKVMQLQYIGTAHICTEMDDGCVHCISIGDR